MATATNTTRRSRAKAPAFPSKRAHMRALLREGKSITEIMAIVPKVGYAFVYGTAKVTINEETGRPYSETAANRRSTKIVTVNAETGVVTIALASGSVIRVNPADGSVKRSKA